MKTPRLHWTLARSGCGLTYQQNQVQLPTLKHHGSTRACSRQSPSRPFSTASRYRAIAAPEIGSQLASSTERSPTVRVVPASPSYFTGKPDFTDELLSLQALLRKYETLPVLQPAQAPRVAWKTLVQYRLVVGEPVGAAKYHRIIEILQRLNRIHPALIPPQVKLAMERYKRDTNPFDNRPKPRTIDRYGRATGTGRRKTSTARVWLVEGNGEVLINGRNLVSALPRVHDRESALWALKATERLDKYNVWALVDGGGTTGQAEALTLGVARALLVHEPMLKPALRRGKSHLLSAELRMPLCQGNRICSPNPLPTLMNPSSGQ